MSNSKFYLLHSETKSKWFNYVVQQLTERKIFFIELDSIKQTLNRYYEDEQNSFIFIDIMSSFSSFELQALRGTKCYCIIQCKFELQKTKERIVGQKLKEICIKGSNIIKCISMFSFITDFDPIVEIKSIASGHVNARLGCSEAYIHFELTDPSLQQGYRYCVDTESENFCFMIFNDNPVQKMVIHEIELFISDQLNLRDDILQNPYLNQMIYLKRMGELCLEALEKLNNIQVKPIFLTKSIQDQHKEKLKGTTEEQILVKDTVNLQTIDSVDNCIADSKLTYNPIQENTTIDSKMNQLFGEKVQFCTTGTAAINQEALFEPLKKLSNAHLSAFYTSSASRGKDLYQKNISEGVKYYSKLENLIKEFNGVAYVPSLPGQRKEQEMLSFIRSNQGRNIVLAEKPAFANYQCAEDFLQRANQIYESQESQKQEQAQRMSNTSNLQDRIFIGWHYIHHPAIQEVVTRIQQGDEFGPIKNIKAHFVRPKPFSTSGRIFEPKQGGCGLDRFCYPLHIALTLAKFQVSKTESADESSFVSKLNKKQKFQVIEASHLNYNEIYDQNKPEFEHLEGRLESRLILNQSIDVELYSSMETNQNFYSEATIIFENKTEIKITWFIHPHHQIRDFNLYCTSIKYANKKAFQPFNHQIKFDKSKSSYDYQIEQMTNLKNGIANYNTVEDRFNLCTESNTYLHLVLDNIFTHSGLKIKEGL